MSIFRSAFPQENAPQLCELLVNVTGRFMSAGTARVTTKKLFVAVSKHRTSTAQCTDDLQITSLALKLNSLNPPQWPDWLSSTVETLSRMGASTENLMDFCTIAAEEVGSADLLSTERFVHFASRPSIL